MRAGFDSSALIGLIPRLRRYARALTHSGEAGDDLVQDTLERAWSRRERWQEGSDLRAWLFSVMHNVFVSGLRRQRPASPLDPDLASGGESVAGVVMQDTADARVVRSEIHAALLALSDEQREAVLLVGLEQLSYAEAAVALGVPIGTVMSRLSRGRARLRELLDGGQAQPAPLRRVK